MDKYEYNVKIEQIRQAIEERDSETAVQIADELDWRKEKDVTVLTIIADAYEMNRDYKSAKTALLIAYEYAKAGRQLAYRLALLSAKTKDFEEAEEFYHDFVDMAPRDTARYILLYKIMRAKGAPIKKLISILEEYVEIDMEEKWMYELAKLYHHAGEIDKCVDICDEMSLWFNHGDYVLKALDLKKQHAPLTKRQEENYNKSKLGIEPVQESFVIEDEEKAVMERVPQMDVDQEEEAINNQATIPFTTMKKETFVKPDASPFGIINVGPATKPEDNADTNKEEKSDAQVSMETVDVLPEINLKPFEGDGSDTMDIQAMIAQNIQEIMEVEEEPEKDEKKVPERLTTSLDPLYKYDDNGQIGLNIEEPKKKEKELTGQLSIEEVLKNLAERGVLKQDTVQKTFETMELSTEAVRKAAEESALAVEEEKNSEVVIEDIDISDLMDDGDKVDDISSAIESYAMDSVDGIVFTSEIDSDAIEKALQETEIKNAGKLEGAPFVESVVGAGIPTQDGIVVPTTTTEMPKEEEKEEEIDPIAIALGKQNLDEMKDEIQGEQIELSANVPVLDLTFDAPIKRIQPGIAPVTEAAATNTADLTALFENLDKATKMEIGIDDQDDVKVEAEVEEVAEDIAETKDAVEEETLTEESVTETEVDKTETENIEEEPVEEQVEIEVSEDAQQDVEVETPIVPKKTYGELEDMPQVRVSTNKKLTQTASLDLSQIIVTDEEMKPFDSFKTISGIESKIKDTVGLAAVSYKGEGHSKTGNIMILGDEKTGKTTMGIELIKLINKKRLRNGRRIAKVDASVLNTRGIRSSMKKLVGSDLIVENAQHLRNNILEEFVTIAQYYTDDMLIVFEGEASALKTMRNEYPSIAKMFDHVLVIKEYDVKEWVAYAKKYAASKNYMIDEMGTLALYKAIDDFYGKHQGIDQIDVESIINSAIKKASSKVTRKLTNLFSGKNDDNGMDIIKEVDFKI